MNFSAYAKNYYIPATFFNYSDSAGYIKKDTRPRQKQKQKLRKYKQLDRLDIDSCLRKEYADAYIGNAETKMYI